MVVTGLKPGSRDLLEEQTERIAASELLKGSESLRRLLRYLAEHSTSPAATPVKEYQIATEVFGRPADFDPRLDSTVRVQTSRLRSKLAEYYGSQGADDRVVLDIPRGSYHLAVYERPAPAPPADVPQPAVVPVAAPNTFQNRAILFLSLLASVLLLSTLYLALRPLPTVLPVRVEAPRSLVTFWAPFVDTADQPWAIFSNAEFSGKPQYGMHYYIKGRDSKDDILDHYTGVGEVLAIHALDQLFANLHHGLRVKRGRLLSMDDAQNNDLIFIGSPSENLTLREIATTKDFTFHVFTEGSRFGDVEILNNSPRPGEGNHFLASAHLPIDEDYAVVAIVPGISAGHWAMILAGTTTLGTQAAVEYVCREHHVRELLQRIDSSETKLAPFEAVIHTRVSKGVPVESKLVAFHKR